MKKLISLVMALAMILSLAACGGDSQTSTTAANEGTPAATTANSADTGDKTFVVTCSEDSLGFDPGLTISGINWVYDRLIYDCLIRANHDGTYEPGLFAKWEANEDSSSWTVELRKDVKFNDGSSFTTKDIYWNFTRLSTDSTLASYTSYKDIEKVEVIDDYNCVFHFKNSYIGFPSMMSAARFTSAAQYEKLGDAAFQVGNFLSTGPYFVKEWKIGDYVLLEQNPYWFDASNGTSNCKFIKVKISAEETSRVAALQTGEADFIYKISQDQIANLEKVSDVTVKNARATDVVFMIFNCADGKIFNDINMRLAWAYAIDRQTLCDYVIGSGEPMWWPATDQMVGYSEEDAKEGTWVAYNPDKAKEYLAKAGYNGEEINFIGMASRLPNNNEVLQAIVSMAQAVGMNVKLEILDTAAMLDRRNSGGCDVSIASNAPTNGDHRTFYWYHVVNQPTGEFFNQDQALLDTLTACYTAKTEQDSREQIVKAWRMLMGDGGPLIPVVCLAQQIAYRNNISNFKVFPDGYYDFTLVQKN